MEKNAGTRWERDVGRKGLVWCVGVGEGRLRTILSVRRSVSEREVADWDWDWATVGVLFWARLE